MSVTNLGIDGLEDVEQIGTGGSSRVYRARQVELDRVVAVKVLNPGGDQGVAKRFDRERKAMGRLSLQEGIVPIYSSGVTSHGEPFLVMPYYPNGSLQDQIDAGPMEWKTAVSYVDVAAETIAEAHDEGIVHLDLKPANILLTNTGAPRIADFGIARLTNTSATAGTTAGTAFTPAYSAPETFLDGETGPPSDVYGLGATLWALLVGHPPFLTPGDDSNLMAVIGRVVNNQVGDLRHIAPEPICQVIERAMAKRPGERFQSAREFSQSLKQAAAGTSPDFAPPADSSTTLFPAVDNGAMGPDTARQTFSTPAGLAAGPPGTTGATRNLLQETAEPLPKPVGGLPNVAPAPFIDLDRFRIGPILVGALAFFMIVGAAAWVFFRQPDTTAATDQADEIGEPASPSTSSEPSGASALSSVSTVTNGSTSQTSDITATTTGSASSSALTTATTDSSTTANSQSSSSTATSTSSSATTGSSTSVATSSATTPTTTGTTTPTSSSSSSSSSSSTATTVGVPGRPTDLTATSTGETEISLSWTAPSSGPTPDGYQVRRNGTILRNDVSGTSFTDRNLAAGTYTYTVRAIGDNGDLSPASNTATTTVGPLEITAFTVDRQQPTRVSVSFSANKCVTYRISAIAGQADDPAPEIGPAAGCTDSDSVIISGLDPDADYQINLIVSAPGEDPVRGIRQAPAPE